MSQYDLTMKTTSAADGRGFAIGILTVTAVILLVGNILISRQSSVAWASGMTTAGGDYILTVGRAQNAPPQNPEELLYVIDTGEGRLVAYAFDARSRRLMPTSHFDLKDMAAQAGDAKAPPARPGTRQPSQPRRP